MIGKSNMLIDGIYSNGFLEAFKCENEKTEQSCADSKDRLKFTQSKLKSIFELHPMYFHFI